VTRGRVIWRAKTKVTWRKFRGRKSSIGPVLLPGRIYTKRKKERILLVVVKGKSKGTLEARPRDQEKGGGF